MRSYVEGLFSSAYFPIIEHINHADYTTIYVVLLYAVILKALYIRTIT